MQPWPPSLYHLSICAIFVFCSRSASSTLIFCVFITLVGTLAILILQITFISIMTTPPTLHHLWLVLIRRASVHVLLSTPLLPDHIGYLSVMQNWLGLQILFVKTYSVFLISLLQFLLLDWLTMCLVFTGVPRLSVWSSLCFRFHIWSTANTLTGNFFCTCARLSFIIITECHVHTMAPYF